MNQQTALSAMRDVVALWYVGQSTPADIVYAACDLLAAGLDGPSLRELAAVSVGLADFEVPDLLEPSLHDVGLTYHRTDSDAAKLAGLIVMVTRTLSNVVTPRELLRCAYAMFGYESVDLATRLADFDDDYENLDSFGRTREEVDAEVMAEVRWIATQLS